MGVAKEWKIIKIRTKSTRNDQKVHGIGISRPKRISKFVVYSAYRHFKSTWGVGSDCFFLEPLKNFFKKFVAKSLIISRLSVKICSTYVCKRQQASFSFHFFLLSSSISSHLSLSLPRTPKVGSRPAEDQLYFKFASFPEETTA